MKPLDLTCVLRVSNTALAENGFKEAVVEQVYQLLIEYCANESHRISFPDLIVPSLIQVSFFIHSILRSTLTHTVEEQHILLCKLKLYVLPL